MFPCIRYLYPLLLLLIISPPTLAAPECPAPAKLLFQCLTQNGKQIQVCDAGKTIDYSFGKSAAQPEIVVRSPRQAVTTYQWPGMGRHMTYALDIPNGNTVYSIFWSQDKLSPQQAVEAGVDVERNGMHIASVKCASDSKIFQFIEGINVRPRD